jgi:hypothetical protein
MKGICLLLASTAEFRKGLIDERDSRFSIWVAHHFENTCKSKSVSHVIILRFNHKRLKARK